MVIQSTPPMACAQAVISTPSVTIKVRCGGTCGQIVEVAPQGEGMIQFACPHCHAQNQVRYNPTSDQQTVELPSWWKRKLSFNETSLDNTSSHVLDTLQKLLDSTWRDIVTRDRKGLSKTPRFQVVQAQHNCNPKLWRNYIHARDGIAAKMTEDHMIVKPKTTDAIEELSLKLGDLNPNVNEMLLFHGTKPSACEAICKSDFMVSMSGSNAGNLYGSGIYFAECSSKSDEYAQDDTGIYKGLWAMLLCRVTCGRIGYCDELHPNGQELYNRCIRGQYDSTLGDREKARGTYREFIVPNNDQAYPEWVIIYKRIDQDGLTEMDN